MKKNKTSYIFTIRQLSVTGKVGLCYGYMMLLIFPLVYHDYYFDITATKFMVFAIATAAAFSLMLLSFMIKEDFSEQLAAAFRPTGADVVLLVWLGVNIISCIFSIQADASLVGENARWQGLLSVFLYVFAYFVMSRATRIDLVLLGVAMLTGGMVALLGVLNHYGIDPLGFYERIKESQMSKFLSTLGNINIYSSFACMMFAATFALLLFDEEKKRKGIWCGLLLLFSFGTFVANSDSGYIGIVLALGILFLLAWKNKKALTWFFAGAGIFAFSLFLYGKLQDVLAERAVEASGLTEILLAFDWLLLAGAAICFALAVIYYVLLKKQAKSGALHAITACVAIGAIVVVGVICRSDSMAGFFEFNDEWGTYRGYVWSRLWRIFTDFSPGRMLIGAGQGTILELMTANFDGEMQAVTNSVYDSAHNEYLQAMITTGVLGAISYVTLLVIIIVRGIRYFQKNNSPEKRICMIFAATAVIAYAGQAFFSLAQPITTPLLFIFLGWMERMNRMENK